MKLAGGHLWPEQTRLQFRKGSLCLLAGDYQALGDANNDKTTDEKEPEDLLNSRGNLDTLLLVHGVKSLPIR